MTLQSIDPTCEHLWLPYDWADVLHLLPRRRRPGIHHFTGSPFSGDWFEYRDNSGILRALLIHNQDSDLFMMTEPRYRRRGIMTKLLSAATRHITIDFEAQTYSESGAAFMAQFLQQRKGESE